MKIGEKILVCNTSGIVRSYVVNIRRSENHTVYEYDSSDAHIHERADGDVLAINEGVSWCSGWDGPAADALRVAYALAQTDS